MAKRPRWTWEEDRLVERLYPTMPARELAKMMDRTAEAIRDRARRVLAIEIESRQLFYKYSPDVYEKAIELWSKMPASQVAKELGVNTNQAKNIIKNAPRILAVTKNNMKSRAGHV